MTSSGLSRLHAHKWYTDIHAAKNIHTHEIKINRRERGKGGGKKKRRKTNKRVSIQIAKVQQSTTRLNTGNDSTGEEEPLLRMQKEHKLSKIVWWGLKSYHMVQSIIISLHLPKGTKNWPIKNWTWMLRVDKFEINKVFLE